MTISNGTVWLLGRHSPISMRPGVVSTRRMNSLPLSSVCGTRLVILECSVTAPTCERLVDLGDVGEDHALAGLALAVHRQVVEPEHHVLRGHDDRLAVGGGEDVVGAHHQHARFELGLEAQRDVHGHLVAVEVGVERRADQRVELDRLALDQHRLERLDAEAVERRRAVQQHRVLADHLVEDVPDFLALLLDPLLGLLEGHRQTLGVEPGVDERLEQLERHLLGQAALVQLELGTGHDHRAARIVDALAEQVLAEPALLALEHVAEAT